MGKVKVVLDDAGLEQLLTSEEVKHVVEQAAQGVLDRCPDIGFGMSIGIATSLSMPKRARAFVGTRSVYSARHNNKHDTLRRALG